MPVNTMAMPCSSAAAITSSSSLCSTRKKPRASSSVTGSTAGAEVAQVYVGDPSARVPRPAKELKGFERVDIQPGASKRVTVKLNQRAFAYWDTDIHGWKVDPGKFMIYVGDSSENTPLTQAIAVQ